MIFFSVNVLAQGQGNPQAAWLAVGNDTVRTWRFTDVNNSLRISEDASILGSARIGSIMSALQAIIDNTLSVGGNTSLGGELTVAGSGTLAGNFSIGQGLDVTGQTQTGSLLVNQKSILGIASAFKLTADSIAAGYLSASAVFTGTIDAGNLSVSGNSQFTNLTADTITTGYLTATSQIKARGLFVTDQTELANVQADTLTAVSINSGNYLLSGSPFTGSQWITSGSNIYFQGGNVGIGTTVPAFPFEVHGNAAVTGTVFADRIAAQSNISIGTFRFINGASIPGSADTIRTPAGLQVQATGTMSMTTAETLKMRASGTVEITSESDTIKLAAGTVSVVGPGGGPAPTPPPTPVALDVVGDVRVSGTVTASGLNATGTTTLGRLITNRIVSPDSLIFFGDSSVVINHSANSIEVGKDPGPLTIQPQLPPPFPTPGKPNHTILNPYMGRVGIGTTTPGAKLHVGGSNQAIRFDYSGTDNYYGSLRWAGLQLGNNGDNRIIAGRTTAGGNLKFYVNNTNDAADYTITPNGTLAMTIASSGNVGIGTTSPAKTLHIAFIPSNADAVIGFSGATAGNDWTIGVDNSDGGKFKFANTIAGNSLNTNAVVTIDKSGTVNACKVVVELAAGCDFVFDKNYNLIPLKKRKEITLKNKRLWNMKPAKEMEEKGADLGATSMGILQISEEHELYLYNHDERIEKLEKENVEQKVLIDKLMKELEELKKTQNKK